MCKKMPLKMMLQSPSRAPGEQGARFRGEAACASSCLREAPWAPLTLQGAAPVLLPQQSPSRVRLSPAPWGTSPSPPPQHLARHPTGTRGHGEEGRQHCTCRWNKVTPSSYGGLPRHQLKLRLSPSCKSNKLLVFLFLTRRTGDRRGSQRGPGGAPCPQSPPQSTQPPFSLLGCWQGHGPFLPSPWGVCGPGTC